MSIFDVCMRLGQLDGPWEFRWESVRVDLPGGWRSRRWRATASRPDVLKLPPIVAEGDTAGAALLAALEQAESIVA